MILALHWTLSELSCSGSHENRKPNHANPLKANIIFGHSSDFCDFFLILRMSNLSTPEEKLNQGKYKANNYPNKPRATKFWWAHNSLTSCHQNCHDWNPHTAG